MKCVASLPHVLIITLICVCELFFHSLSSRGRFDCGMHMGYSDERRFPEFRHIRYSVYLFIF